MSELNNQPGLFDQEFDQELDQELELNEQNPTLSTAVPLLTYLLSENRIRIVDCKVSWNCSVKVTAIAKRRTMRCFIWCYYCVYRSKASIVV